MPDAKALAATKATTKEFQLKTSAGSTVGGDCPGCIAELEKEEASSKHAELATASAECVQVAADHEATIAAHDEELAVICQGGH